MKWTLCILVISVFGASFIQGFPQKEARKSPRARRQRVQQQLQTPNKESKPRGVYIPPRQSVGQFLPPADQEGGYVQSSSPRPGGLYLPPNDAQSTSRPDAQYLPPGQSGNQSPNGQYLPPGQSGNQSPNGQYLPPGQSGNQSPNGQYLPPGQSGNQSPNGQYLPPQQPGIQYGSPDGQQPGSPDGQKPQPNYLPPGYFQYVTAEGIYTLPQQEELNAYLPPTNQEGYQQSNPQAGPGSSPEYLPPSAYQQYSAPQAQYNAPVPNSQYGAVSSIGAPENQYLPPSEPGKEYLPPDTVLLDPNQLRFLTQNSNSNMPIIFNQGGSTLLGVSNPNASNPLERLKVYNLPQPIIFLSIPGYEGYAMSLPTKSYIPPSKEARTEGLRLPKEPPMKVSMSMSVSSSGDKRKLSGRKQASSNVPVSALPSFLSLPEEEALLESVDNQDVEDRHLDFAGLADDDEIDPSQPAVDLDARNAFEGFSQAGGATEPIGSSDEPVSFDEYDERQTVLRTKLSPRSRLHSPVGFRVDNSDSSERQPSAAFGRARGSGKSGARRKGQNIRKKVVKIQKGEEEATSPRKKGRKPLRDEADEEEEVPEVPEIGFRTGNSNISPLIVNNPPERAAAESKKMEQAKMRVKNGRRRPGGYDDEKGYEYTKPTTTTTTTTTKRPRPKPQAEVGIESYEDNSSDYGPDYAVGNDPLPGSQAEVGFEINTVAPITTEPTTTTTEPTTTTTTTEATTTTTEAVGGYGGYSSGGWPPAGPPPDLSVPSWTQEVVPGVEMNGTSSTLVNETGEATTGEVKELVNLLKQFIATQRANPHQSTYSAPPHPVSSGVYSGAPGLVSSIPADSYSAIPSSISHSPSSSFGYSRFPQSSAPLNTYGSSSPAISSYSSSVPKFFSNLFTRF